VESQESDKLGSQYVRSQSRTPLGRKLDDGRRGGGPCSDALDHENVRTPATGADQYPGSKRSQRPLKEQGRQIAEIDT